jgi:very-short-patch-repair endonuclease
VTTPRFLRERARQLRAAPSPARQRIWELVRGERQGVKFRREHPLVLDGQPLIVDFCSPRAKLVIDVVDAGVPVRRRELLEAAGYRVLWVTSSAVLGEDFPELLSGFVAG